MRFIFISLLFNLFWFAAVVGQNQFIVLLAALLIAAVIYEPPLLAIAPLLSLIGWLGDNLLAFTQVLVFPSTFLPLWMYLMWLAFAAYLWLIRAYLLTMSGFFLCAIAAVGGTLSYFAGDGLDAVAFHYPLLITSVVLLVVWGIYGTVLLKLIHLLDEKEETWRYVLPAWLRSRS